MVINTNIAAITSANNLDKSTDMLNQSLARLSSGSKIVNASDDPAGLAESISLNAEIGQSAAASSNVANAVSFLQTQDGYLQQIGSALDQMASLAVEAQDGTMSSSQLADYQSEYSALAGYITDTTSKSFNGVTLFSSTGMVVTIDASGDPFTLAPVNLTAAAYTGATSASISSPSFAAAA